MSSRVRHFGCGPRSAVSGSADAKSTSCAIAIASRHLWGEERNLVELLKLGIRVAKRTVQKHMRSARPLWRLADRFIVDFAAPAEKLIVEVDGRYHRDRVVPDARRDRVLGRLGYRVLRLRAELVLENPAEALRLICAARSHDAT